MPHIKKYLFVLFISIFIYRVVFCYTLFSIDVPALRTSVVSRYYRPFTLINPFIKNKLEEKFINHLALRCENEAKDKFSISCKIDTNSISIVDVQKENDSMVFVFYSMYAAGIFDSSSTNLISYAKYDTSRDTILYNSW